MDDGEFQVDVANLVYLEEQYSAYLSDPLTVSAEYRNYFAGLGESNGAPAWQGGPDFAPRSIFSPANGHSQSQISDAALLQDRVDQFIRAFRVRGHMEAQLDPLGRTRDKVPELHHGYYDLGVEHLGVSFSANTIAGPQQLSLHQMILRLRSTYCRTIGVQFMHIDQSEIKQWLQTRMELSQNRIKLTSEQQRLILAKLTDAVILEEFIQKKYLGAKTFSLEGGESLIPLLMLALNKAGEHGLNGVIIGMPHRGRLSVLANIIGKNVAEIFQDFEGTNPEFESHLGDVKYHQGHSSLWKAPNGHELHLSLCFNPSHLEFVNPVSLGRARANIDRYASADNPLGMAILIHGDAAFAGQGIIQEILNLSQLDGYKTGGTLHVIVNNQIGFTTDPRDSRSTQYASDIAKMLQCPIFHVNGEDPEAVAQVVDMAMDFRHEFNRDAVIDMYCYRRRGHNEGDEPSFTQPQMYQTIKQRPNVREIYRDRLVKLEEITFEEADDIAVLSRQRLDKALTEARRAPVKPSGNLMDIWSNYHGGSQAQVVSVSTAIPAKLQKKLLKKLTEVPDGFTVHPKIKRWLGYRMEMAEGKRPLDWGAAEALAFASIALEGLRVRLSGQDSQRGTFTHRHAVLHDQVTGAEHMPLQHLDKEQAQVNIFNSPLSEAGVLGFDYGYSLDCPDALVLWEAQFGDFANGAQVIIDQFLTSAEDKWNYLSGLVMLLPHGFEGMGSEHSSARLERFLLLAANDNIQVVNPTTPAQFFHVLRRQVVSKWRKPLIVLTPKSLLRHPEVTSEIDDLRMGRFRRVLYDQAKLDPKAVKRVLCCSGKIYYELNAYRREHEIDDVAIIRLEQYYPFPRKSLNKTLEMYGGKVQVTWVQEEPENMGAWQFLYRVLGDKFEHQHGLQLVSRPEAASPATGSSKRHAQEQQELIVRAFADI